MDPNAALRVLREMVEDSLDDVEPSVTQSELAEQVQALDEWLSKGGFPPDAWVKVRTEGDPVVDQTQPVCPRCGEAVTWDTEHLPSAWRHLTNESRWCDMRDDEKEPGFPQGAGDPDRHRCEECGAFRPDLTKDCQTPHCIATREEY